MPNLNIDEAAYEAMEKLAAREGCSVDEVLRKAVGTQKYIADAEDQGKKILVEDRRGYVYRLEF